MNRYKHQPEYDKVPETPETREFVYRNLVDFFGIDEQSDERPGGKRRGFKHSSSMSHIVHFLDLRAEAHNARLAAAETKIILGREATVKVLNELSILDIASAAYMYERLAYFEAKLFTAEEGYSEEDAKEAFKFSPRRLP